MKTCPSCSVTFEPRKHFNSTIKSKYCDLCTKTRQALKNLERIKKEDKKRLNDKKKELLTLSDHLKLTQMVVNKYIRLRDKNELCISCGKKINGVEHASHYLSSGGHSNIRFHEDNIWKSCYKCNVMLSGNPTSYRIRLIKKIGVERVEWLEDNAYIEKKWTREELKEIQEIYKAKIKNLK